MTDPVKSKKQTAKNTLRMYIEEKKGAVSACLISSVTNQLQALMKLLSTVLQSLKTASGAGELQYTDYVRIVNQLQATIYTTNKLRLLLPEVGIHPT